MKERIIKETTRLLKRKDSAEKAKAYLKSEKLSEREMETYLEVANQKVYEQRLVSIPKNNRLKFLFALSIAFITFISYFFILPQFGFRHTTTIAIIGGILLSLSLFFALVYYNSWSEESVQFELNRDKNVKPDYSIMLAILPIPIVIFTFIFTFPLEWGENNFLKETQEKAQGRVISRSSNNIVTHKGTFNFSSVTVEFETKNGQSVIATEEISEREYKNFHEGQIVNLIYSKTDPENIDLLTHKSDIIKFTGSEERDFTAEDLLKLLDKTDDQILEKLNKVRYGWIYNSEENKYELSSKSMVFKKDSNRVELQMGLMAMYYFPNQFIELGFKDKTEGVIKHFMIQKLRILENEKYFVSVDRTHTIDGSPYYLTIVEKK
ncbi:MAG: hypothetical protein AB8B72_11775 [Crocinitomicaceae bacterium]